MIPENKLRERIIKLKQQLEIYEELLNNEEDNEETQLLKESNDIIPIVKNTREEKIKFFRVYQNQSLIDILPLYNKRFHSNYSSPSGNLYKLYQEAKEEKITEGNRKNSVNSIMFNKHEKFKELSNQGLSNVELANQVGVSIVTIMNWKKKLNENKILKVRQYKTIRIDKSNENIIRLLKIYYLGSEEEKNQLYKELETNKSNFSKWVAKYKVRVFPSDVGLSSYPKSVKDYRHINDFII